MAAASGSGRRATPEPWMETLGAAGGGEVENQPVQYTAKLAAKICEELGGGLSCSELVTTVGMPSLTTFYRWRKTKPKFELNVSVALAAGATRKAEEALKIAKEATKESLPLARLQVDLLMKHAAQMSPQEWGRRVGGAAKDKGKDQGGGHRKIVVRVRDFTPVTRADGTMFTREILPNGRFRDFER